MHKTNYQHNHEISLCNVWVVPAPSRDEASVMATINGDSKRRRGYVLEDDGQVFGSESRGEGDGGAWTEGRRSAYTQAASKIASASSSSPNKSRKRRRDPSPERFVRLDTPPTSLSVSDNALRRLERRYKFVSQALPN